MLLQLGRRSLAGDFGFDPAGLGEAPEALKWYQQAELLNGRTAMVANAGILFPAVRCCVPAAPAQLAPGTKIKPAAPGAVPLLSCRSLLHAEGCYVRLDSAARLVVLPATEDERDQKTFVAKSAAPCRS